MIGRERERERGIDREREGDRENIPRTSTLAMLKLIFTLQQVYTYHLCEKILPCSNEISPKFVSCSRIEMEF